MRLGACLCVVGPVAADETAAVPRTPDAAAVAQGEIIVGSKKFTEAVILGEIATLLLREEGWPAQHRRELGGTRVLFSALERGEVDVYPEYTGTIRQEILRELDLESDAELEAALRARGIRMTAPLGFNNTYALGMRPEMAARRGITRISDLRAHPDLRLGLTNEFLDRGDGWPSLRRRYQLPQEDVVGLDHDLAYRALAAGEIDVMDFYSTDAEIDYYGFRVIADDREHFTTYDALYLYRADLAERAPRAVRRLESLAGTLDEAAVRTLNARVKIDGEPESAVAADFLRAALDVEAEIREVGLLDRMRKRTLEHLFLVAVALGAGIVVALPLGVLAHLRPRLSHLILGIAGIIQTIPSLALLVFMIPLLGIAAPPAIAALFLYSWLPMVRNTHSGLRAIPLPITESAAALGLSSWGRLLQIELPLATPSILAGIKTSAVITIGFATLGALIGAGGFGQPILTGIRLDDYGLILEGAVPAALLALLVQWLFDLIERAIVPRGLRLRSAN
ncbi:MAG: ABC transporter permease subunit [Candidatus Eisenbacteria bacterium]|nr:ABC transporter permease subunit [Candidatus Eisenbacteria bacterium]